MKVIIVGAGLASAIAVYLIHKKFPLAEIIVYEKNDIGGLMKNDVVNDITIQLYGPHVFHTTDNNIRDLMLEIFNSLNINWETYYIQVLVDVDNKLYTLPYSKLTGLSKEEYYSKVIEPYTLKQWGNINKDAINRLHELNYYTTHYHGPATFSCVFDHNKFFEKIFEYAHVIYKEVTEQDLVNMDADIKIYTGYRENCQFKYTKFDHQLLNKDLQCYQINTPDITKEYTRIIDFCYMSNKPIQSELHPILYEIPCKEFDKDGIICYPLGNPNKEYENIVYLGRFGKHKYFDMECVVNDVLTWFNNFIDTN